MRAVQTFTVVSKLPTALEPLRDIAMNLGWNADYRAQEVFRHIDGQQWPYVRDPAGMLAIGDPAHLESLAGDAEFTALAAGVRDELVALSRRPRCRRYACARPCRASVAGPRGHVLPSR